MDGRHWNRMLGKMALAGSLFAGAVGCDTFSLSKKSNPWSANLPPAPPPAENSSASGKTVIIPEPEDPAVKKDGPLQSTTLMTKAAMNVEIVSKDLNRSPADREALLSEARRLYNEVLQREPQNVEPLIGLAQMYQMTGESEKLMEIERRMREQHPSNAKVWAWIAVRQGQANEWDNCAESYHQAVKLDPDNRLYRMHLGFSLARANRYKEGYAWLSRCMRESEARYHLALMMMHNGHLEDARQQLESALQSDPNCKRASHQLAALNNGFATPTTPMIDPNIQPAVHNQPVPILSRPTMSPPDPLPLMRGGNDSRLPPPYTATSGWDTTLPPSRR